MLLKCGVEDMMSSRNTTSISLASLMQSCNVVRSLSPLLVCPGEEREIKTKILTLPQHETMERLLMQSQTAVSAYLGLVSAVLHLELTSSYSKQMSGHVIGSQQNNIHTFSIPVTLQHSTDKNYVGTPFSLTVMSACVGDAPQIL